MSTINDVCIIANDGQSFKVSLSQANRSKTIKTLIEDGTANCIILPDITGPVLAKVIEYLSDGNILDFVNVEQWLLFELVLVAKYLDIEELLDLICMTVMNSIKGQTPDEIRKTLNIDTPENEWIEDCIWSKPIIYYEEGV
jgi:S-phase kinase-associated protein 1